MVGSQLQILVNFLFGLYVIIECRYIDNPTIILTIESSQQRTLIYKSGTLSRS